MNIGGNANTIIIRRRTIGADGKQKHVVLEQQSEASQLNLNMYLQPETGTITLEEFQTMGLKRLSVLRLVESLKEKHGSNLDEYREAFRQKVQSLMPLAMNHCKNSDLNSARREDRISHFILRLAFCQTQEQSDWFIRQESELFRLRFQIETEKNIRQFLNANGIQLNLLEVAEKSNLISELCQALSLTQDEVFKMDLYKVDFVEVVELLSSHRLFLKEGIAYISSAELIALVGPRFRENISCSMAHARRQIGFLQEEDRLMPLMKHMVRGDVAYRKEFQDPNAEHIAPDMLDSLAQSSFPLCMRNIHISLRREHHLRHFARRQYGLFLKGIGLSMEGSLEFFRAEFSKKMDNDKFTKEYAYNIRHLYGKEGSRVEQKPFSCATIIFGNIPTAQDCHGCPFKHSDVAKLTKQLEAAGLRGDQLNTIADLSKMNRFDKACTKFFEYVHNVPELEDVITHPNQYYSLSRKVLRADPTGASQHSTKNCEANKEMETDE